MTRHKPTILLVGLGHLGGALLESLAHEPWVGRIVACSRGRERGEARCNLARLGAAARGLTPHVEYRQADLSDTVRFAELLHSISPQVIVGAASLQTWWLPELLPPTARSRLRRARFGAWLPLHLSVTRDLMAGVRAGGFTGPVLTAPFPDVVNCVLGKIGLAPTCGIGNIEEIATKVRWLAAARLQTDPNLIRVEMVAHHALEEAAFRGRAEAAPPYFLRIRHEADDVTEEIGARSVLFAPYRLPAGAVSASLTAATTIRLLRALNDDRETLLHVPGPEGLPGGYPVRVSSGRIAPSPIAGLELREAVAINEGSHVFDGVQRIESDGTTVFTDESIEVMKRELGYDCPRLAVKEAAERGQELKIKFRDYAARLGLHVDRIV